MILHINKSRIRGWNKVLNERALRNQLYYKQLDSEITQVVADLQFQTLENDYKHVIGLVGDWPLTWLNAIEAMHEGDWLGICLDVSRTEAAIADPNQLTVKDVIPTFMSWSAYLESAAFNLEKSSTAHGSFSKHTKGWLATGLGRENVTGILPLYLFKEHWEISKRTLPSIFGFMCTLDIMGYESTQFYTIPFAVLFKCYNKIQEKDTELNQKILSVVKQTCWQIILRDNDFSTEIVNKLKAFEKYPIKRTKVYISTFKVFFAQILCWIDVGIIDKHQGYDWMKIIRFIIEEGDRRAYAKGK